MGAGQVSHELNFPSLSLKSLKPKTLNPKPLKPTPKTISKASVGSKPATARILPPDSGSRSVAKRITHQENLMILEVYVLW